MTEQEQPKRHRELIKKLSRLQSRAWSLQSDISRLISELEVDNSNTNQSMQEHEKHAESKEDHIKTLVQEGYKDKEATSQ